MCAESIDMVGNEFAFQHLATSKDNLSLVAQEVMSPSSSEMVY